MKKNVIMSSLISLTFLAAGCDSGSSPVPPVKVEAPEKKTGTATFNIGLTGMAVKGTMANATISVQQIDATTGVKTPISFRVAGSTAPESYSVEAPAGTSDAQLDALIAAKVLAATPENPSTDDNGLLSVYLENNFSGAVIISVTSDSSVENNWLRCDSYSGCGNYEDTASTVVPNDGDLVIEFGEWYKEDLTLNTIKYIAASDAPDVSRNYTANATIFSEIVATILQENIGTAPISQQAISDASVQTVMQLFGPDGLIENGSILSDISTGVGFDLNDISGDTSLNTGNTSLAQFAASLQTVAAAGGNGSLAEIIAELATSVSDGTLNAAAEEAATSSGITRSSSANNSSPLFDAIQARVTTIAAIYVAIVTGDTTALETLGVDAAVVTSITASVEAAVESGAITQQELVSQAVEIVALVEVLGCTGDECTINEGLYSGLAAEVTAELAILSTDIANLADDIDAAKAAIAASSTLGESVEDADTAVAYYESAVAAHAMVFDSNDINMLGNKANTYDNSASAWVDTATFLVAANSEYQSLHDTATDIASLAHSEAMQVNGEAGVHVDAQALLTDATAKLTEFDAVVAAAKSKAESSNDMAIAKQGMTTTAQTTATASHEAAMALNDPQSVEAAAAYVAATEQALADKLAFIATADTYVVYAGMAHDDAADYASKAVTEEDIAASGVLVTSSTAMKTEAAELATSAEEGLSHITDMVADAKAKQVDLDKLPMVKETTQSFADINVITTSGRDALGELGEVMFDVLNEANQETGDVTDKDSTTHDGWKYSFNETNMTISASHATQGSFQGVAELSNDGSETTLLLEWSSALNETTAAGTTGATFNFSSSASTLTFDGIFTSLNDLEEQEPTAVVVTTDLTIMDGDADFDGTLTLKNYDLSTTEAPEVYSAEVIMDGMSGEVAFTLTFEINEEGQDETLDVTLMIGDSYMMKGDAENGADITGSVWLDDYNYGDFSEMSNGVVVTYIDGEEVEYVDLSFTIDE